MCGGAGTRREPMHQQARARVTWILAPLALSTSKKKISRQRRSCLGRYAEAERRTDPAVFVNVTSVVLNHFLAQAVLMETTPLSSWARARWIDMALSVAWLIDNGVGMAQGLIPESVTLPLNMSTGMVFEVLEKPLTIQIHARNLSIRGLHLIDNVTLLKPIGPQTLHNRVELGGPVVASVDLRLAVVSGEQEVMDNDLTFTIGLENLLLAADLGIKLRQGKLQHLRVEQLGVLGRVEECAHMIKIGVLAGACLIAGRALDHGPACAPGARIAGIVLADGQLDPGVKLFGLVEIALAGFLSLGGEVFVHQFGVARVVAAVFGAGPIASVDQPF